MNCFTPSIRMIAYQLGLHSVQQSHTCNDNWYTQYKAKSCPPRVSRLLVLKPRASKPQVLNIENSYYHNNTGTCRIGQASTNFNTCSIHR